MGRTIRRLSIIVAVMAMLGASACTAPPPLMTPGCYEGPFGIAVDYVGPINTVNNATSNSAADCTGTSTGDQTVVYGPDKAWADAECVALGRTQGAFGEIADALGNWVCVVYPPELAAGCYVGPWATGVAYVGPINTVDNATTNSATDCTGTSTNDQTVVYGQSEAEADAACVTIGKPGGVFAELSATDYWACVV